MNLQTKAKLPHPKNEYSHANRFVCLGSCFAAEIGQRLENAGFDCSTNPLGTSFNPIALCEIIERSINGNAFTKDEFFQHKELWRHFLVHSSLASPQLDMSLRKANAALSQLRDALKRCDLLILTLGTANVYTKTDSPATIGHNHKLPLSQFERKRLTPNDTATALRSALVSLRKINSTFKVCCTVSPVRHTRDGLHENNLSKASLLLAIDAILKDDDASDYFPAYEILIDELRDYRFFAPDLAHPSEQAIDYIWQGFAQSYFTSESLSKIKEVEAIRSALSHRPQHPDTKEYTSFKNDLANRIESLAAFVPSIERLKEEWKKLP